MERAADNYRTGIDDGKVDGNTAYRIVTAWATSLDSRYHGINPDDVLLTNLDNDGGALAGIVVTPTNGLITSENGGASQFSVVLTAKPTAEVSITLHNTDTSEATVSHDRLTFTPENWETPQLVTVTGKDDAQVDGDQTYTIVTAWAQSADGRYHGINPADVVLTNRDDDAQLALSQLVGDYNLDGIVDSGDYIVWRANLGSNVPAFSGADGSGNGQIGPEDYDLWRRNFGKSLDAELSRPTPQLPGDFNGNGQVDVADYAVWRNNVGTVGKTGPIVGDADGDLDVDGADFLVWQCNFGLDLAGYESKSAALLVHADTHRPELADSMPITVMPIADPQSVLITQRNVDLASTTSNVGERQFRPAARDVVFEGLANGGDTGGRSCAR